MVQQPVQHGRRQRRVLRKRLIPLAERQVARHDQAAFFIALGDHLEEQVGLLPTHRQIADLVNDQQAIRIDESLERLGELVLSMRSGQNQQQVGGRDEANLDACLRGRIPQGDGDVSLASAAWPQQHHVLATLDEGQAGQFLDLCLGHACGGIEIKALQGFDRWEAGKPAQTSFFAGTVGPLLQP